MHNHNNNNEGGGHKGMMWMMLICCALPFAVLFLGGSALSSGGYLKYVIIGGLAAVCFWMMFKGHRGHGDADKNDETGADGKPETKDKSKHGCCR